MEIWTITGLYLDCYPLAEMKQNVSIFFLIKARQRWKLRWILKPDFAYTVFCFRSYRAHCSLRHIHSSDVNHWPAVSYEIICESLSQILNAFFSLDILVFGNVPHLRMILLQFIWSCIGLVDFSFIQKFDQAESWTPQYYN